MFGWEVAKLKGITFEQVNQILMVDYTIGKYDYYSFLEHKKMSKEKSHVKAAES